MPPSRRIERRDYGGPSDLRGMQELVRRVWSPARRFHIGDLAWGRYSIPGAEETFRTSLWWHDEAVMAWAWLELPGHLELLVDPRCPDLLAPVLNWFEATASGSDVSVMAMNEDAEVVGALQDRGFLVQTDGPFFTRHMRELVDLLPVVLPEGFTITTADSGDAERRASAHRAGWSDFASRVSGGSYADLMRSYPYRSSTDLIVVAPSGEWVASALGWYDEVNEVGLVEPVSCAPAYRRRGLGRAVNVALLHAFRDLGGTAATVLPRGDDAYPAPGLLYRSIGYQSGARTRLYSRRRPTLGSDDVR